MTTSRINAYRWPARLVSHKPFAAERYFITSSSIWQVFFAENYDFSFFIFSVLSIAAFSVQDAQSRRFLPVENSPAPLCSNSMDGKSGGYTYYIGNSLPSKPCGFASSLWEGAFGMTGRFLVTFDTSVAGLTACALSVIAARCHLSQRERQDHCQKLPCFS